MSVDTAMARAHFKDQIIVAKDLMEI